MEQESKRTHIADKWKGITKEQWVLVILSGVLLFMISMPWDKKQKERGAEETKQPALVQQIEVSGGIETDYASYWEKTIGELLSQTKDVGKVKVILNMKSSMEEIRVEKQKEEGIFAADKETEYVIKKQQPKVAGVVIVCDGFGKEKVETQIRQAVSTLLSVEDSQIIILPMRNNP